MPPTQTMYATISQKMKLNKTPRNDACVMDQKSAYQSGTTPTDPPVAASVNISRAGRGVRHRAIATAQQKTRCQMTRIRTVMRYAATITSVLAPSHTATGKENKFSAVIVKMPDVI